VFGHFTGVKRDEGGSRRRYGDYPPAQQMVLVDPDLEGKKSASACVMDQEEFTQAKNAGFPNCFKPYLAIKPGVGRSHAELPAGRDYSYHR